MLIASFSCYLSIGFIVIVIEGVLTGDFVKIIEVSPQMKTENSSFFKSVPLVIDSTL